MYFLLQQVARMVASKPKMVSNMGDLSYGESAAAAGGTYV
jgi:hypothetical protein